MVPILSEISPDQRLSPIDLKNKILGTFLQYLMSQKKFSKIFGLNKPIFGLNKPKNQF